MNDFSHIIQHLDANSAYGVAVTDRSFGTRLRKPYATRNKYIFTKQDILSESPSVEAWIKALYQKGFKKPVIDIMQPNGTSNISKHSFELNFVTENGQSPETDTVEEEPRPAGVLYPAVSSKPHHPYPTNYQPMYQGLGTVAMNPMDVIEMSRSKDQLLELKERNAEYKETIQELRADKKKLEAENSAMAAKLEIAEAVKDIAVERKALEQRSFMESPVLVESIKALGAVLPDILMKRQAAPALGAAAGNLSQDKQLFIEAMQDDRITDKIVMLLHYTLKGLVQQPDFEENLAIFLKQRNIMPHE